MSKFNPQEANKQVTAAFMPKNAAVTPAAAPPATPEKASAEYLDAVLKNFVATQSQINTAQVKRAEHTSQITKQAVNKVAVADKKLATTAGSPLSDLVGIFNPDYNRFVQQREKQEALQTLQANTLTTNAQNAVDAAKLQAAKAPLEMLQFIQSVRQGQANLKVSQMQLVMSNASLQAGVRELKQTQITVAEAKQRAAEGNYTADIPESFVIDKLLNHQKMLDDVEASADAKKLGKLNLADRQLKNALERLSVGDGRTILQGAKKFGLTSLDLGGGLSLPMHQVKARVAELETQEFEQEKALANRMVELEKYATRDTAVVGDAISTALTTVAGESGVNLPAPNELMNMPEEELVRLDLFNKLPTEVATATFDLLRAKQRLDEQLKTKDVGAEALLVYNTRVEELQKVTKQHTDDFIAGVDKKRQPAFRRLVSNGMIVDNPNQAAQILVETGLQLPNFNGNEALRAGFQQFVLQYGEQKGVSGKVSMLDTSPEAQEARFEALMSKFSFGGIMKETDHTELLKAINVRPSEGTFSVKETVVKEQATKVFYASMQELAAQNPDVQKLLFNADGSQNESWFNEKGQVSQAQVLVNLVQLGNTNNKDPSFYVQPLSDAVNKVMEAYKPQMEGFTSTNAQSFLKMVFPFENFTTLVDRDLDMRLRTTLNAAIVDAQRRVNVQATTEAESMPMPFSF